MSKALESPVNQVYVTNPSLNVTLGIGGTKLDFSASTSSTPGVAQDLISQTVPVGKSWELTQVVVSCRFESKIEIYKDADLIGNGEIGPGDYNFSLNWNPSKPIAAGSLVKVRFLQDTGTPSVDVKAYLQLTEISV